jgi:fatty acid CoA ligase FadD9
VPMTTGRYAHGYAVSKWASEHLLRGAATLGIPVNILRGPMMLPHRHTPGVINTDDVFIRLLHSVIVTGLAPHSFYRRAIPGIPGPAGYDALGVDVVAAAVVAATDLARDGCVAVNLSPSPTPGSGSLDDIVGWIETAGYPVERVPRHAEWLDRFRAALEALPPTQKAASALEVLAPYADPLPRKVGRDVATRGFRQLVGPGGTPAPIDEAYIHKCIADLRHLGLIPEPR